MVSSFVMSLPPLLASGGMVYAFWKSDLMGQSICVGLFLFSMVVWYVMAEKSISLHNALKKSEEFMKEFREKKNPLGLRDTAMKSNSPAAAVYLAACSRIESVHLQMPTGGRRAMTNDELEVVRSTMAQTVEDQLAILMKRTLVITIAVGCSPHIGLFGTVWGITVAFTELAQAGPPDVKTLAPGVSGALLTTVVALFVAIPSMIFSNYISSEFSDITVHLDNFVDEVSAKFKIEQLDSYRMADANQE